MATLHRAETYNQRIDIIMNQPSDCHSNIIADEPAVAVGRNTKSVAKLSSGYNMGIDAGQKFLTQAA